MPRVAHNDALEFMDEFMEAIHTQFPKLVIQHEDFATERAFEVRILPLVDASATQRVLPFLTVS